MLSKLYFGLSVVGNAIGFALFVGGAWLLLALAYSSFGGAFS